MVHHKWWGKLPYSWVLANKNIYSVNFILKVLTALMLVSVSSSAHGLYQLPSVADNSSVSVWGSLTENTKYSNISETHSDNSSVWASQRTISPSMSESHSDNSSVSVWVSLNREHQVLQHEWASQWYLVGVSLTENST